MGSNSKCTCSTRCMYIVLRLIILVLLLILPKLPALVFYHVTGGKHADAVDDDSYDRVGWISHAIEKRNLKPGDHIYSYRAGSAYSHHGIYVGEEDCEVIHFSGTGRDCDDCPIFLQKHPYKQATIPLTNMSNSLLCMLCRWYRAKNGAIIQKSTLADFSQGSEIRLVAYDVPWHALIKRGPSVKRYRSTLPNEVITRAKKYASHPDKWGNYNVLLNTCNCETFAVYCKTGIPRNLATQGNFLQNQIDT